MSVITTLNPHLLLERADRQTTILLELAARLHANGDADELAEHVCEAAVRMTRTKRAALVRWSQKEQTGEIAYATRGHLVASGAALARDSQAARVCARATPLLLEDAHDLGNAITVYGGVELPREVGALAIIPLRGVEQVTGAIVVEGDRPGDISAMDGRHLQLLGHLTAASLDTVWAFEAVTKRARTDALTGLPNHHQFDERLARLVVETDRFGGAVSVVLVDVDRFKYVNDKYGQAVGDEAFAWVAAQMASTVRAVDLCARYGGDELGLLLPQTDVEGASRLAERLRARVEATPCVVQGYSIALTASFGVASYPAGARSGDEVFALADRALCRAKRQGGNQVVAETV